MSSGSGSGGRTSRVVEHTYRDFSLYLQQRGQVDKHKKVGANFPAKLHQMLSDSHFSNIIVWMPHGRAWRIEDKERLMDGIHKYFALKRFHSFIRQLSGWGFKRLHQPGLDHGCYYHECFLRGIPLLTWLMRRVPTNTGKSVPHIEGEPDFYAISELYPLPPISPPGHFEKIPAPVQIATSARSATARTTPITEPMTSGAPFWMNVAASTSGLYSHSANQPPTFQRATAMTSSMSHVQLGSHGTLQNSTLPSGEESTSSSAQGLNQHAHNQYQSPLFPYLTTTPIDGERNNMMNCPSHAQPDLTSSEQHPSTNYSLPAPSYYNYYQYPYHNDNSISYHHTVHYHHPWQHYSYCNLSSEGGSLPEFFAPPFNSYDAPLHVDGYSHISPAGHLEHRLSSFSVSSLLVEERQDQIKEQSPQVEDKVRGK
ncbi:hypothetical protein ACHAWU_003875 [Discostella pseudostelligera]|uniref:HSF-type DNA-binding domain-containing protein n=1 Tax=Discostella pseudostelligera TaxID=259834 RepID=A0ABD3M0G8_9STRA